ncbi:MAG: hypothetical protein J6T15_04660 [Bacilli bacterium]|nr:hypothetical protein [Bacilli bacterium]
MIIIRKEVKCDVNILKFMYPTFEIIDNDIPLFPERPAIYIGSTQNRDLFIKTYEKADIDYIVVSNTSSIDLTDRRQLVQVSFEKWNRFVPQYLVGCGREKKRGKGIDYGFIDELDYEDFLWVFKHHWVTGKWVIKKLPDENTFLELIELINQSKIDFIKRFFEVVNDTRPYRIESSLMTFLLRAKYKNYKGLTSPKYKFTIKKFEGKPVDKSLNALYNSLDTSIDNYTLRLLYLFVNILDTIRS